MKPSSWSLFMDVVLSIVTGTFILLKVAGVISWEWLAVLSPLWVSMAFIVLCGLLLIARNGVRHGY